MKVLKNILKNTLKSRRLETNLSQDKIARKVNINQASYSNMERGNILPSLETCLKLSVVLGFDMEDLKKSVMEELR